MGAENDVISLLSWFDLCEDPSALSGSLTRSRSKYSRHGTPTGTNVSTDRWNRGRMGVSRLRAFAVPQFMSMREILQAE